jgi:glutamine amidotransferase
MKIAILNYGCGNIGAIPNMLRRFDCDSNIVSSPAELKNAEKIILPGVGAFGHAMNCLRDGEFIDCLNEKVLHEKRPVLGICLGMQLLGNSSEENPDTKGLGWINGEIKKFIPKDKTIKVPHMGWNNIDVKREEHPLLKDLFKSRFYHVHSYHYGDLPEKNILATAHHGYEFPTIIAQDNIMGAQFHPEKSHRYGLQLLKNFAKY